MQSGAKTLLLSINDYLDDADGTPACWPWSIEEILQYVLVREANFLLQGFPPRLTQQVSAVANFILRPCLSSPYSSYVANPDGSGSRFVLRVDYHNCKDVPITDVYTALGWFISITDPRVGADNMTLSSHLKRLMHYTRLCQTISKVLGVDAAPAKTHLLVSVHYTTILTTEPGLQEIASLSSSLPRPHTKDIQKGSVEHTRRINWKEDSRVDRALTGSLNGYEQHSDACYANVARGATQVKLGHCAETLNIFSQMVSTRWIYVWGAAMNVGTFKGIFKGYEYYKSNAHTPPCCNCRVFFARSNATFMDICNFQVHGPLPPDVDIDRQWMHLRPCQKCGRFVKNADVIANIAKLCVKNCEAMWCVGDEFGCLQENDEVHARFCRGQQLSQAGPSTHLAAVPGTRSQAVSQQYSVVPIHHSITPQTGRKLNPTLAEMEPQPGVQYYTGRRS